jgi:hydrogenase/urease accessory protein HupE
LVFAAPDILRRLLVARFLLGFGLLLALTAPGLVRLLLTSQFGLLAALAIAASVVSWGLCLGALCRNPRPFELVLIAAVYAGLQGVAIFDLSLSPQLTALWHIALLAPAWLALAWAWPRLARR